MYFIHDDLEDSENQAAFFEYNSYRIWNDKLTQKESIVSSCLACVLDGEDDEYEDLFE